MSPSYHHSYLCTKVARALDTLETHTVLTELTLAILEKDYVPDVSVYPKRSINFLGEDTVRMTEMPITAIEILSPSQTLQDALDKFKIYFKAGIKSCWLVVPATQTVTVYSEPNEGRVFHSGELVDPALNIRIPVEAIFRA